MKRFALFGLSLVLTACSSAPPAQPASTQAPPHHGVLVETDQGTMPLSAFSLGLAHQLPVANVPHSVPKVKTIKAFIVNLENVRGGDAAVYWVNDPALIFAENQQALPSQVSDQGSSGYAISAPSLAERTNGYAMLVLKSPEGGPSRYYAVQLGAS